VLLEFQKLLKSIGMEERKEGNIRRKITLHSFRRHFMSVVNNQTSSEFSHYLLGHSSKSPYFVQKELDRRLLYATKCMQFLTFIDYSKLEEDADEKRSKLEMLMLDNANKDRKIEELRQQVQALSLRTNTSESKLGDLYKEYESFRYADTRQLREEREATTQRCKRKRTRTTNRRFQENDHISCPPVKVFRNKSRESK
jgi:hypothetical protein